MGSLLVLVTVVFLLALIHIGLFLSYNSRLQVLHITGHYQFDGTFVVKCTATVSNHFHCQDLHSVSLQVVLVYELFTADNSSSTAVRCWAEGRTIKANKGHKKQLSMYKGLYVILQAYNWNMNSYWVLSHMKTSDRLPNCIPIDTY